MWIFGTVGKKSATEAGKLQRILAITRHRWLVAEPFAVVAVDVAAVDVSPELRSFLPALGKHGWMAGQLYGGPLKSNQWDQLMVFLPEGVDKQCRLV